MNAIFRLSLMAAAVSATACAHLDPDRVQADYGSSNRVMVRNQLFDPEAANSAGGAVVTGLDGQKAGGVVRAYRGDNATRSFSDAGVDTNSVTSSSN